RAVTPEEARRIEPFRANRLHLLDIGLFLERGDALKAVRITYAADRIVLGAEFIEAFAERLDALWDEVRDKALPGHTQPPQIIEREPVMAGLLARALFEVGRDLGPPQRLEAACSAPEISRRVDRCVIRTDQGDDITGYRRVRGCEALFNSSKSEIYRTVEEPNRAARRACARHRRCEWICLLGRDGMKPNLSRLASDDRNIAADVNPLRDQLCHVKPPTSALARTCFLRATNLPCACGTLIVELYCCKLQLTVSGDATDEVFSKYHVNWCRRLLIGGVQFLPGF